MAWPRPPGPAGAVCTTVRTNMPRNAGLRDAADGAGAPEVWLAYEQDPTGAWVTGIPAAEPGTGLTATPGGSGAVPADPPAEPPGQDGTGPGSPIAASRPLEAAVAMVGAAVLGRSLLVRRRYLSTNRPTRAPRLPTAARSR